MEPSKEAIDKVEASTAPKQGSYAEQLRQESLSMEKKNKLKSIKSLPKRVEYSPPSETNDNKTEEISSFGEDPFDTEKLASAWQQLIELRTKNGGRDSEILLLKQKWELKGTSIILTLTNAFQLDILNRFHTDIVGYLRKELNNRHLELKSEVSEIVREDMLYTNREKFEYLMKLNPQLRTLKDRLELDPDF